MRSRRKIFYLVGSALAAIALSQRAYAIDYPLRFVRIVVPFPPGGPNDVLARTIGRRLSELCPSSNALRQMAV
jgi:tripartite-type tricarboxylate transporter receptor subunit TctC